MKAIFDACRRLTQNKDFRWAGLPRDARGAVWHFERCNRGHSHVLDHLASARNRLELDEVARTRQHTLCSSTGYLLLQLGWSPDNRAALDMPELQELLSTKDTTGFLARLWEQNVMRSYGMEGLQSHGMAMERVVFTDDGIDAYAKFTCKERPRLSAIRVLRLRVGPIDTLKAYVNARQALTQALQQETARIQEWPEFSEAAWVRDVDVRTRKKLETALSGFTYEERAHLLNNWSRLKPQSLNN